MQDPAVGRPALIPGGHSSSPDTNREHDMSHVPDRARPTITSRIGVSLPAAIGALLFAGAIAFGSGMVDVTTPLSGTADGQTTATDKTGQYGNGWHDGKPATDFSEDNQQPAHQPDKTPKPESTPKPQSSAKPQPKPEQAKPPAAKPAPPVATTTLQLSLQSFDAKVKLTWSTFSGSGFAYYKVVRSNDATVAWPAGSGDALVGAIGDPNAPYFKDFPPCNANWHYRVFAVAASETGYTTLAASNVAVGYVACVVKPTPPPPPPPPTAMALSATVVDGQVHLTWEKCTAPGFAVYKVVRSQSNADPMYPLNSGSELIAAIGDPNLTQHGRPQRGLRSDLVLPGAEHGQRRIGLVPARDHARRVGDDPVGEDRC